MGDNTIVSMKIYKFNRNSLNNIDVEVSKNNVAKWEAMRTCAVRHAILSITEASNRTCLQLVMPISNKNPFYTVIW